MASPIPGFAAMKSVSLTRIASHCALVRLLLETTSLAVPILTSPDYPRVGLKGVLLFCSPNTGPDVPGSQSSSKIDVERVVSCSRENALAEGSDRNNDVGVLCDSGSR